VDPVTRGPQTGYALSVWLEPGHDGGGLGAWLVDVPGVFAAVPTPQRALSAILTSTARTREWLEGHGDDLGLGMLGRVDVAGETPASVLPDGYEVNATFPWDRRPLDAAGVAVAVRRLGWQLDDLLALAADVDRFEHAHGPLPTDDATGERTADAVLRHVAGASAWYVEQLDGARSGIATDAGDAVIALAGARAWASERLTARGASDDGREATDEHGETWTLAKVIRRSLYHAFDHLWELDRRLARADGTADRVVVTLHRRPDATAMVGLLRSVGWDGRTVDPDALGRSIDGTPEFAAAWDGDRLVGTARSLTDGAMYAHIATVVVHPRFQGLGVGERLMHALMDGRENVRFALSAAPGMDAWYAKLGFAPDTRAMVRQRRR
jgi:ribosomal protein S18 acetylase RimI-like enzyme